MLRISKKNPTKRHRRKLYSVCSPRYCTIRLHSANPGRAVYQLLSFNERQGKQDVWDYRFSRPRAESERTIIRHRCDGRNGLRLALTSFAIAGRAIAIGRPGFVVRDRTRRPRAAERNGDTRVRIRWNVKGSVTVHWRSAFISLGSRRGIGGDHAANSAFSPGPADRMASVEILDADGARFGCRLVSAQIQHSECDVPAQWAIAHHGTESIDEVRAIRRESVRQGMSIAIVDKLFFVRQAKTRCNSPRGRGHTEYQVDNFIVALLTFLMRYTDEI
jgi:hypothetical protein